MHSFDYVIPATLENTEINTLRKSWAVTSGAVGVAPVVIMMTMLTSLLDYTDCRVQGW